MNTFRYCLVQLLVSVCVSTATASSSELTHGNLRGRHHRRKLQSRQYTLWSAQEIHATLLEWGNVYPNLVRVTTAQEAYGLPAAGNSSDCPYDEGDGCLNYILTIQDYALHSEGTTSSNALPEVFWSGELHGDERVGPTVVMEAAALLLNAASCQVNNDCTTLEGISQRQQQWLARLVATRRIVIVPTANALGYYQDVRKEGDVDANRDFPFDYEDPSLCMRTIAGRTLNEVFREHIFQLALTFHAGFEMIGYEWGADSFQGTLSPDDEAQSQIAIAYSNYGGSWSSTDVYLVGPMDQIVYTVKGGMEDWAYAGSWIPELVVQCQPSEFGGYSSEKTIYNDGMLRAFNMLVETCEDKNPASDALGTSFELLNSGTSGNGHVSRNIRLALLSVDLVEPYLSIVAVNDLALSTSIVPLAGSNCEQTNTVRVLQTLSEVTVEWTVGGALEIDETRLYYGKWSDVSGVDCLSQPSSDLEAILASGLMIMPTNGTGYFSKAGASPSAASSTGDLLMGPVFKATVNLSSFEMGDEVIVVAKARVDQSWLQQPSGTAPQVTPQSHIVNARTNPSWYHTNNNKVIQGRLDWYSIIPLTLVISNTTDLEDSPGPTPAPVTATAEPTSQLTNAPTITQPVGTTQPTEQPFITLEPTSQPVTGTTMEPTVLLTPSPTSASIFTSGPSVFPTPSPTPNLTLPVTSGIPLQRLSVSACLAMASLMSFLM